MRSGPVHLLVIAKAPVPGRVKTRLCPPCTPHQAATLAAAALADTLDAVCRARDRLGADVTLILDGTPGAFVPSGVKVLPQRGHSLDERLAAAFDDTGGPGLLIGMDTPQIRADTLVRAVRLLETPGTDAVLGEAVDGGWWAIGLHRPDPAVFLGVPMTTPTTHHHQRRRLSSLGLRTEDLPVHRDVDVIDDAHAVAAEAPTSRFAAALAAMAEVPA